MSTRQVAMQALSTPLQLQLQRLQRRMATTRHSCYVTRAQPMLQCTLTLQPTHYPCVRQARASLQRLQRRMATTRHNCYVTRAQPMLQCTPTRSNPLAHLPRAPFCARDTKAPQKFSACSVMLANAGSLVGASTCMELVALTRFYSQIKGWNNRDSSKVASFAIVPSSC